MRQLITILLVALYASNTPANECFDDKKLAELRSLAPNGAMVYVWSPRMVYSVQNMDVASRAAEASGMRFVALHDSRVSASEMPILPMASLAMCSQQLIASDALRHFPSAFVITQHGIHRHAIVGAMPASAWLSSIAQRLAVP